MVATVSSHGYRNVLHKSPSSTMNHGSGTTACKSRCVLLARRHILVNYIFQCRLLPNLEGDTKLRYTYQTGARRAVLGMSEPSQMHHDVASGLLHFPVMTTHVIESTNGGRGRREKFALPPLAGCRTITFLVLV